MSPDFVPRRFLVTGASRGIGRAVAMELTARGHEVIATARNRDDLKDLPARAALELDVTNPESVERAATAAGVVDVVLNNAGASLIAPASATPPEDVTELVDVNALGPLRVAQAFVPRMMQRRRGTILQVSSPAARFAPPLHGAYAASKAALERLTEALRFELRPFGIHVGIVVVGAVRTELNDRAKTLSVPPYERLVDRQRQRQRAHASHSLSPEQVAKRIADVAELGAVPARTHVGSAPERLFGRAPASLLTRFATSGLDW